MTVLGGARPMPMAPGALRVAARVGARPMPARRRLSRPDRASRRAHPVGILLAAVLVTFMLGLIYLAQTIHIAATNYRIEQLAGERGDLHRQVQTVETSVLRWGTEPTVFDRAQRLGLDPLPPGTRLIAR